MSKIEIGVVVNYYNPTGNKSLIYQTLLSAMSYRDSKVCMVTIVDGSGFEDDFLKNIVSESGMIYLASNTKLKFAKGYNNGIDFLVKQEDIKYIILSANDIIVPESLPTDLLAAYLTNGNVGCVIPYLTKGDYYLQNEYFSFKNRFVPLMTLNCNFFNKEDLLSIGRVPEYLSGYFNDVVMSHRLHQLGKRILIAKRVLAIHLVSKTVAISSSASYEADWLIFKEQHSELTSGSTFVINAKKFNSGEIEHFFSLLMRIMPGVKAKRNLEKVYYVVYGIEAFFFKLIKNVIPRSWSKA